MAENRQTQIDGFSNQFQKNKKEIENELEMIRGSTNLPVDELQRKFDGIQKQIQSITKLFSDATIFLPAFEIKQYQQTITNLEKEVANQKNISIPKQKFSFKTKKQTTQENKDQTNLNQSNSDQSENKKEESNNNNSTSNNNNNEKKDGRDGIEIKNKKGESIEVKEESQSLFLVGLNECQVRASSKGSIFVDNCHNCKFYIRSQQIRIHGSSECEVWLEVWSNPIIEHCSSFKFHPLQSSSLSEKENKWDKVEDFNWLKPNIPSPNFSLSID